MRRFQVLFLWLFFSVLILLLLLVLFPVMQRVDWKLGGDVWSALTAAGTVGATVVAVVLSYQSWVREKNSTARLVTAWIADSYAPRPDGDAYIRTVKLHIANESNEPVFDGTPNIQLLDTGASLGPLSVSSPLSVIPPRRELVFDISIPLLAHTNSWQPAVTLSFIDPRGKRWKRESNGNLTNVTRKKSRWSTSAQSFNEDELGDISPLNPMVCAFGFLNALRDPQRTNDSMKPFLASLAAGWDSVKWDDLNDELENYQPTSMVSYPASRIARIKLSGDTTLEGKRVEGDGGGLQLKTYLFLTLTLDPNNGWGVFGVGGTVQPNQIFFDGSLNEPVLPYSAD
ncbi:hypothetical protein ACFO7V_07105 [Glutamicibacter bergerei]|uniref:Uncharacterized protein n=1 Tax=Glutamicibacter bergerei TaxID=256702 RepID=A0ABV9MMT6_9MICC|nr:hypothetical protein [Micrococcaceae bacterium]